MILTLKHSLSRGMIGAKSITYTPVLIKLFETKARFIIWSRENSISLEWFTAYLLWCIHIKNCSLERPCCLLHFPGNCSTSLCRLYRYRRDFVSFFLTGCYGWSSFSSPLHYPRTDMYLHIESFYVYLGLKN
jgi:hypothetical protein